jgi:hypothetical protein
VLLSSLFFPPPTDASSPAESLPVSLATLRTGAHKFASLYVPLVTTCLCSADLFLARRDTPSTRSVPSTSSTPTPVLPTPSPVFSTRRRPKRENLLSDSLSLLLRETRIDLLLLAETVSSLHQSQPARSRL